MKRCIAAFLLLLVLLQCGGLWWCYKVSLDRHRRSQREAEISKSDLVLFTFSASEFNLHQVDEHELQVDGVMYDIDDIQNRDGQVRVWAAVDKDENQLQRVFSSLLEHEKDPEMRNIVDFSQVEFIVECIQEVSFVQSRTGSLIGSVADSHIGASVNQMLSPPPEVLEVF